MSNKIVFMYLENDKEMSNETLHNICQPCAKEFWGEGELEMIDAAGWWDECCKCSAQNVPPWYRDDELHE